MQQVAVGIGSTYYLPMCSVDVLHAIDKRKNYIVLLSRVLYYPQSNILPPIQILYCVQSNMAQGLYFSRIRCQDGGNTLDRREYTAIALYNTKIYLPTHEM